MKLIIILLFVFIMLFTHIAFALQIITPKEGQIVYQGDRLTVIAKSDTGENWKEVLIEAVPMSYNFLTKEYKAEIEIPRDGTTGIISFFVAGYDRDGKELLLTRSLFVKLPPNVLLQSLIVEPNPLFLDKLPAGSDPDDVSVFGTRDISVKGVYSDGVKRKLTGNTYTSSNEKVVTVSSEGKATAQGIGKATITVRNGKISVDVRVIVDPYKE